jgi:hypothetical protein
VRRISAADEGGVGEMWERRCRAARAVENREARPRDAGMVVWQTAPAWLLARRTKGRGVDGGGWEEIRCWWGSCCVVSVQSHVVVSVDRMIETIERPRVRRLRAARPPPDNEHFPQKKYDLSWCFTSSIALKRHECKNY